jgi:phosphatidylserine/phosphatidylglycerophosphate/cardiolipin synthase-like enzyme
MYGGGSFTGADRDGFTGGGVAFIGLRHELVRPVIGIFGVAAEAYAAVEGGEVRGGGRLFGTIRALLLQGGVEIGHPDPWPPQFILTLEDPILRGGLLGNGSTLRFEWTPAARRFALGVTLPLFQPLAGGTRPRAISVSAPPYGAAPLETAARDSATERLLDGLRTSALWIDVLTTPFVESSLQTDVEWTQEIETAMARMATVDDEFPDGHTYPAEVAAYHRQLRRLFAHAVGTTDGDTAAAAITALARAALLEQVVLPANRDFGQRRSTSVFDALRHRAMERFAHQLDATTSLPPATRSAVLAAFAGWMEVIESVERAARSRWDDSRLVWLPFQLALTPEEHDSQSEIDRLLESVTGEELQGGNEFEYLINEAFSPELIRSIHQARDYHVLWIHDFPGTTSAGTVDRVGARVVADGYLAALTQRVLEFDATGRIPTFMVFVDQWYFDARRGRRWANVLQDPLGLDVRLPAEARDVEQRLRDAQSELRAAVAGSTRLQRLTAERGEDWLRRYVKVHVSITYPGDPSFRRRIGPAAFVDDFMRDHRKIVFWDLTERDPSRGGALFTGEGVGEDYEGARWEDRTLLVRGPSTLALKREARRLLQSHGIDGDAMPPALRPQQPNGDRGAAGGSRLLQVHNATGYGAKRASALRAAIYNLSPQGTRLLIPDSQWSSFFWAGMLVGSALRGCLVFPIAPRPANAPYGDAFVQTVLTHDVLEAYLQLGAMLRPAFAASGGGLWVGLYGQDIGTRSIQERYRAVLRGILDARFPREAFPFPDETYARLNNPALLDSLLEPTRDLVVPQATDDGSRSPRLHLKSQLIASATGIERALRDPAWFQVFVSYIQDRAEEYARGPAFAATGRMGPELLAPIDSTLHRAPDGERARDVFYLLTGSQNQNDRSLLLDGESVVLVAGVESLATLIDFVAIAARSTWVETQEELDALLPRQPRWKDTGRARGRWVSCPVSPLSRAAVSRRAGAATGTPPAPPASGSWWPW